MNVGQNKSPTFFFYNSFMSYYLVKLNTARNALRYVINTFSIEEIYLPYYICPVLRTAVKKENCKIKYYHIDRNFRPVKNFPQNAFILYPNYFGICSMIVDELAVKYENLIVDNAHSYYSEPRGIASFNSLRKFFPKLRDGAFLYTRKLSNIEYQKDEYIYEPQILSYRELCLNEDRLDKEKIKYISETTLKYLPKEDIKQRIEKFNYWENRLDGHIKLSEKDVPFSYPYFANNVVEANEIVNQLKKEGITIFRYWNNMPDSYPEKIFYTNLVSISLNTSD